MSGAPDVAKAPVDCARRVCASGRRFQWDWFWARRSRRGHSTAPRNSRRALTRQTQCAAKVVAGIRGWPRTDRRRLVVV